MLLCSENYPEENFRLASSEAQDGVRRRFRGYSARYGIEPEKLADQGV